MGYSRRNANRLEYMKEFKIRCSAIGKIMTNPKTKGELLSETAKTYCKTWYKEQLFNRTIEFSNKYTQKGLIVEDNSIDFIGEQLGYGFLFKNEKFYENKHITGTPDIVLKDLIIDVKNSWDFSTFPILEEEIPNKDYYWQAQGYMELTGTEKFKLCYVLSDTPQNLIEREARYWCLNNGLEELDLDVYNEFEKRMTYPDISNKLKIKTFDIQKNKDDIQLIVERVEKCREYITNLKNNIK